MLDTKALAEATALIVREHVEAATQPLLARIATLEARQPEKGLDGAPGRDGVDGKNGSDGKDGADGAAGEKGADGRNGADGIAGADGKDGVGLAGAVIDRAGGLILTLTDGTTRELGLVVGKDGRDGLNGKDGADGAPGRDGADGFGFDDLSFEHDGERGFVLRFVKGERTKEFSFQVPVVLDRGVWREGDYSKGDGVSWGGSFWIAQKDTDSKPDSGDGWRLAVKRGRDGKDKA